MAANIRCKYCRASFTSVLVIPEKALEEVTKGFLDHLKGQHKNIFNDLFSTALTVNQLSIWLIAMGLHTRLLEEEEKETAEGTETETEEVNIVYNHYDKVLTQVLEAYGIEDDEDEDEDEDEDDEDDDFNNEGLDGELGENLKGLLARPVQ